MKRLKMKRTVPNPVGIANVSFAPFVKYGSVKLSRNQNGRF
ncbi:MAG: hypothetical protein Q4C95_00890 [Planctomycetia bacterium]|nr:hypothetical protein [Planctomycetia bacterium]